MVRQSHHELRIKLTQVPRSFLEGPKAALTASKDFENGHYKTVPQFGIRAFGRAYSAWAYGQTVSTKVTVLSHTVKIRF